MRSVLIETQFLPTLEFFCAISDFNRIELEHHEHFVKQSYRNHTFINTANGVYKLVIPISNKGNRTLVKDLKIDYSQNMINQLWRTIESAYRKSPYYEHYVDDLKDELYRKYEYLVDLNLALLQKCFSWLQWDKEIFSTTAYNKTPIIPDLRNVLLSKKSYSTRSFYQSVSYTQVFGSAFVSNLSFLDLIFCKGPEAGGIIRASKTEPLN